MLFPYHSPYAPDGKVGCRPLPGKARFEAGAGWAAASTLAWTRYSTGARTTATLRRIVRDQRGTFQPSGVIDPESSDVIVSAGLERMRLGRRADFGLKAEAMQDFNRNFSNDAFNLNVQFTTRLHAW